MIDLEVADQRGLKSFELARQHDRGIDHFILSEVFKAHLKLAQGNDAGAAKAAVIDCSIRAPASFYKAHAGDC